MKSFFSGKKKTRTGESKYADACEACGLYKGCQSPKADYTGEGRKKIFILAEAFGQTEDEQWEEEGYDEPTQLIGEAGQLFRRKLKKHTINIDKDCWKMNAISCRPPNNRKPTRKEVKLCRSRVLQAIEETRPEYIWLLGGTALESMYLGRFSRLSISRWRKLCIPDKPTGAWIIPMYHPSFLLRNRWDKNLESTYDKDLKFAVSCLNKEPPVFEDFESQVGLGLDYGQVIEFLDWVIDTEQMITIDWETTNVKPQGVGHKIWSCAISNGEITMAFPVDYPYWNDEQIRNIKLTLKELMYSERVKKIAHNLKFEELWARVVLGQSGKGWHWCTMNAEHIIDSRKDFVGLKFQSYVRFGLEDHNQDVKPFIKPREGSDYNKLDKVPIDKLLLYNGIDALVAFRQYERQKKIFNRRGESRKEAYDLTHKGLLALVDAEDYGIPMDELYFVEQKESLSDKINNLEHKLKNGLEGKKFKSRMRRTINLRSNPDIGKLLFEILRVDYPISITRSGSYPVDKETLANINVPFTRRLLKVRKLGKIRDTYIAQFEREIVDGRIHPSSDLHTTQSYRSSMSKPSFQNIPTRDEEAKKIVRSGIIPSPGNKILCIDYDSMEVRIIACYTLDENLIEYILDPTSDMHKDQAKEIFVLNDDTVTKELRFYTKNQFVFPEFYGSYYVSCARGLWDNCIKLQTGGLGMEVWEHLVDVGVMRDQDDYAGFENHVKEVERQFWIRFPAVRAWQEEMKRFYRKHGYVKLKHGHIRGGRLTDNMIVNTPIQGTAFHCLLWSYVEINEARKSENWQTGMLGQIHDEIMFDLYPEEEDAVISFSRGVMEEDIVELHDWLVVPLKANVEMADIDQSWYRVREV